MLLYKDEKYKNIINYIKRINFKINDIGKLLPEQWKQFRLFIENDLNEQLNIYNIKNGNIDIIKKDLNNRNINNVTDFGEDKRNCVKCIIPITKKQHDLCDKCRHLCILDECNNKRHNIFNTELEFCVNHISKIDFYIKIKLKLSYIIYDNIKKVMKEVLESEKTTIEKLTNRISLLEEQLDEANKYKDLYQELIIKFNLLDE